MARIYKAGVEYFPVDADFLQGREVCIIRNKLGFAAISVLIGMFCELYRQEGYYLSLPPEEYGLLAERIGGGCSAAFIGSVVEEALETGLFDRDVYSRTNALTSKRVQKQYVRICERRNMILIDKNHFLLSRSDGIACGQKGLGSLRINDDGAIGLPYFAEDDEELSESDSKCIHDVDIGTQRKGKKSKAKKSESEIESKPAARKTPPKGDDDDGAHALDADKEQRAIIQGLIPDFIEDGERQNMVDRLVPWLELYTPEIISLAIDKTLDHNAKTYAYVGKVLQNWKEAKCNNIEEIHRYMRDWRARTKKSGQKVNRFADYNRRVTDYTKLEELALKAL